MFSLSFLFLDCAFFAVWKGGGVGAIGFRTSGFEVWDARVQGSVEAL